MKIDYNILWLDDQIDEFIDDEFVSQINTFIEEAGFESNIKTVSKPSELLSELDKDWDLILTDYNMAEMNGAEVISKIRSNSIYTEILFYTAQKTWTDIGRIDRVSFLQTSSIVGSSHHEKVVKEAIRLIGLTIKKFQNIVAMRGLIMHETSSLDAQIDNITQLYLNCIDNCETCPNQKICQPISNELIQQMEKHIKKKLELINKKNFKKIRKDHFLYSADYKRIVLGMLLNLHGLDDFSNDYKDEIVNIRNKFAHAVLLTDSVSGRKYFEYKDEGITFDNELCVKIRRNIRKYKELIDLAEKKIISDETDL